MTQGSPRPSLLDLVIEGVRGLGVHPDIITAHGRGAPRRVKPLGEALERLASMIARERRICLAVTDHTRPTPVREILDALIPRLLALGSRLSDLQVLIASGLHEVREEHLRSLLGSWRDVLEILVHRAERGNAYVGSTSKGTRVEVDEAFLKASITVGVSTVMPHAWAGFSGGSKIVLPGVSSLETVREHHLKWALHPKARPCIVEGNPFREDLEEAGELAGLDLSLNLVLWDGKPYAVLGEPSQSFREAVSAARSLVTVRVHEPYDVLIADARPLDYDVYQSMKAVYNTVEAVSEEGTIILVTRALGGLGPKGISHYMRLSVDRLLALARSLRGPDFIGPLAVAADKAALGLRRLIVLSPSLKPAKLAGNVVVVDNVEEALKLALAGRGSRVAVVPNASSLVLTRRP